MMKRIKATMGTFGHLNERVTPWFLFSRENVMSCSWNTVLTLIHLTTTMWWWWWWWWCRAQLCGHIKESRILRKIILNPVSISKKDCIANGSWFTTMIIFTMACRKLSLGVISIHAISSSSGRERGCQIRRLCGMGICISLCARYYTSQLQGTMLLFPLYEKHADVSRYHCTVVK